MKQKTNEELKDIVNASGWATVAYQLKKGTIEEVIKSLDELQTIHAIDEILDRLKNTESSYKNFEKLKQRISEYEDKRKEFSKYYEVYDEKIKRKKYKYDTTDDCVKIIKSAQPELIDDNYFGVSLAARWLERVDMVNNVLGWQVEEDFTEEQEYKWKQIKNDLPKVLEKMINSY